MMQAVIIVFRFFFGSKELKIVGGVLLGLILLPAMAVVVIASTPQAILDELFGSAHANAETYSTINPAPEGVKILPDYSYPGDNYEPGNCTYWVFARRSMVGLAVPNTFGDANNWDNRARDQGYLVNNLPSEYAIMQTDRGKWGHVAFVEKVDPDGTWHISEMNVLGLFIVNHKTYPASAAADYTFIHTKGI